MLCYQVIYLRKVLSAKPTKLKDCRVFLSTEQLIFLPLYNVHNTLFGYRVIVVTTETLNKAAVSTALPSPSKSCQLLLGTLQEQFRIGNYS